MTQALKNLISYVIDSQTANDKYNQNNSIKSQTENVKSSLCDYSNAFILVTEDITVTADNYTVVAFKSCASFSTCKTEIMMFLLIKQAIFTL